MEMDSPCCLPSGTSHLEYQEWGFHQGGKVSWNIALRFLIISHFPAWRAIVTNSLECLSSTTCVLVRSSSRKILLGSENSFLLALRARRRSTADLNQRKRVESYPSQALSRVTSWRSSFSLRNRVPTTMGSEDVIGKGSPLTLRFNSRACLVCSSMSLDCTTSSTTARGGARGVSLPLATCAHELMCVFVSCLKVGCWALISSYLFFKSRS